MCSTRIDKQSTCSISVLIVFVIILRLSIAFYAQMSDFLLYGKNIFFSDVTQVANSLSEDTSLLILSWKNFWICKLLNRIFHILKIRITDELRIEFYFGKIKFEILIPELERIRILSFFLGRLTETTFYFRTRLLNRY